MFIKFISMRFKNILSYGNNVTSINFDTGLNLISAPNGHGKSTLLEVLSYCLYGKPYRNIKIAELINNVNKKNLMTEVIFKIEEDTYSIIRTLKPDALEITKNDQPISLLSAKKLTQEEIDKILGLNYTMFKQVISLAVTNNKPYLTLSSQEKRDIIESIFNIKVFGQMIKIAKKKISDLKTKIEIDDNTIKIIETSITTQHKNIKEIKNSKTKFEQEKEQELKTLQEKLDTSKESLSKAIENVKILEEKFNEYVDVSDAKIKQEMKKIQYDIKLIEKDINTLNNLKDKSTNLVVENVKNTEKLLILDGKIKTIKKEIEEIKLEDVSDIQNEYDRLSEKIIQLKAEIKGLEADKLVLNDNTCPTCKREMNEEYKTSKLEEINKNIQIKNNSIDNNSSKRMQLKGQIDKNEENEEKVKTLKMDLKIEQNSYDSVSLLIKNNQKEQENCTLTLEVLMSKNLVSELKNKEEAYKQQEIEIENIKEKVTLKNEISLRLATNNAKKSQLSDEIIDLTKRLDSLKVKEFTISIEDLQKQLDIDSQKYQTVYAQNEKSNEDLKNYRFVGEILSEDGIKSYFLKKLLPILNQTVNEYLNKLDLPVQLQFNEKMDETIKGLAGYQNEINYYSLSSGERTKVDISILLSFISVTKAIVNWNCNLILFDEILDANLDSEALNKVLNSLRTLVDNSKELCSYVISHKAQDSLEYFNRIINITKENGFSKLSATLN